MSQNATSLAWVGTHSCIYYIYSGYWDTWLESWDQGRGVWITYGDDLGRPQAVFYNHTEPEVLLLQQRQQFFRSTASDH